MSTRKPSGRTSASSSHLRLEDYKDYKDGVKDYKDVGKDYKDGDRDYKDGDTDYKDGGEDYRSRPRKAAATSRCIPDGVGGGQQSHAATYIHIIYL
jgi:hypothetical protein